MECQDGSPPAPFHSRPSRGKETHDIIGAPDRTWQCTQLQVSLSSPSVQIRVCVAEARRAHDRRFGNQNSKLASDRNDAAITRGTHAERPGARVNVLAALREGSRNSTRRPEPRPLGSSFCPTPGRRGTRCTPVDMDATTTSRWLQRSLPDPRGWGRPRIAIVK